MSDSLRPHRLQLARLLHPWVFSRQEYWSELRCPTLGDLSNPGIKPRSAALQADSLLSEPPRKPKNTGVGSLFLLQGIFLTQRTNPHLLHCRQILYQLSYQQSPNHYIEKVNSVFIIQVMNNHEASQVALVVKNSLQYRNNERMFDPWVGKIPLEEGLANHSSILA